MNGEVDVGGIEVLLGKTISLRDPHILGILYPKVGHYSNHAAWILIPGV